MIHGSVDEFQILFRSLKDLSEIDEIASSLIDYL